jgi:hypothetical protein
MYVGMGIGVNVGAAVVVGATPRAMVDEDCVGSPAEARTVPAINSEGRANGDDWAKAKCSSNVKTRTWCVEDDRRAIDGDVIICGVDGLNFEIAAVVGYVVVGVGGKVAVAASDATLALDGIHDVRALAENRVAEGTSKLRVAGHHVENRREGKESKDAGIPGKTVGLDRLGDGIASKGRVLLGPGGCVRDLVPVGGGGENLGEERIGVECDALDELIKLLRSHRRRWWRSLLLIGWGGLLLVLRLARLRIGRLSGLWVSRLCLLLVGWWRLTDNWRLGKGGCRECDQKCSTKDAGVELIHGLFLWIREHISSYRRCLYSVSRGAISPTVEWTLFSWESCGCSGWFGSPLRDS